jgi:hypothetical protein
MELMSQIVGEIDKATGVPVITLKYGADEILQGGTALEKALVDEYQRLSPEAKTKSVVLDFNSEIAGSPVVRALIKMHGFVSSAQKGQLLVANYPSDFLPALQALGVTSLRGFRLVTNRQAGIEAALPGAANKLIL